MSILQTLKTEETELEKQLSKVRRAIAIFDAPVIVREPVKVKRRSSRTSMAGAIPAPYRETAKYLQNHVREFLLTQPDHRAGFAQIVAHLKRNNLIHIKPGMNFSIGPYLAKHPGFKFIGRGFGKGWQLVK